MMIVRRALALLVVFVLFFAMFATLGVRQLSHWFCTWLDRWFDLVMRWAGMDPTGCGLPYASDTDITDLPPGFGWLPTPNLGQPPCDRHATQNSRPTP